MKPKKIVILGTGGTIAGYAPVATDNVGYTAGQLTVESLVEGLGENIDPQALTTEQVAQLDSKDMSFAVWERLAKRIDGLLQQSDVAGIVVTHGTDTLEETAYFLQALLCPAKPVVLTCAMRPASSLAPDGPQNLADAIAVAQCSDAKGVVVVCSGVIHSALDVQKVHTYRLNPFSSGDAGPIGVVEEGELRLFRHWPEYPAVNPNAIKKIASGADLTWARVEIVMNQAATDGSIVNILQNSGVKAIVVAGTGNGSIHHTLERALIEAQTSGLRVLRSTRCAAGRVIAKPNDLLACASELTPVKARIKLLLELLT